MLSAVIALHTDVEESKCSSLACSSVALGEQGCLDLEEQVSVCPTSMPFPGQSPLGVIEER